MTPTAWQHAVGSVYRPAAGGFFVPPPRTSTRRRPTGAGGVHDGERLARVGGVARPGPAGVDHLDPRCDLGRAYRDHGRGGRRQHYRPSRSPSGSTSSPGFGAILLTFLAGTEIDSQVVRKHFWSSMSIGVVGFLAPYLGRSALRPLRDRLAVAAGADRRHFALDHVGCRRLRGHGRDRLQQDRNRQDHPRRLLRERPRHGAGARRRLRALRPLAGVVRCRRRRRRCGSCRASRRGSFRQVGHRVSEPETKFVALVLLGLGGLATVAGSEAVLPAYLVGMALAPAFLADPELPHRMRIIAFTILTPFYFLKAGSLVDFRAVARRSRAHRRLPRDQDGHEVRRHPAADASVPLRAPARACTPRS